MINSYTHYINNKKYIAQKHREFIKKHINDPIKLKVIIYKYPCMIQYIPKSIHTKDFADIMINKGISRFYMISPHLITEKHINKIFMAEYYSHLQNLDDTIIEKYNNIIYNELSKNLYHVVHLNIKRYRGSKPAQKLYDRLFNLCLAKYFNNDVISVIYSYYGF